MRKYIYGDESGNFDFSRNPKASRYFSITTILLQEETIATAMLDLRRELAWNGVTLRREFHAAEDKQLVRDAVFGVLTQYDFRVDATILDKPKAQPHIRPSALRFYKYAWFYHMKYVAPRVVSAYDEVLVIAASLGTNRERGVFQASIEDVVDQVISISGMQTAVWPAAVDPCLQVADYCSWAIQRKWESGDTRSYDLIKNKIKTEYDLFRSGTINYY